MSRLIVKNLPTYATPEHLRKHFEQKGGPGGVLTDVKVAQKQDGTSRRFGFVGYKTESQATAAKEWFNKTFLGSARLAVDIVEGTKDNAKSFEKGRPSKKPRLGPSPGDASSSGDKSKPGTSTADEQYDLYLQVMQPRNKSGPSWANDAVPLTSASRDMAVDEPANEDAKEVEPAVDAPSQEGLSDLEWMKQRMSGNVNVQEKAYIQPEDDEPMSKEREFKKPETPEPVDEATRTILQTSRLFVRNLAFSCTEAELREAFSPFGQLSQVHIPVDASTKNPKGVAYVSFTDPKCALEAFKALDKRSFQGRLMHILPAVDRKGQSTEQDGVEGKKKSLKDERNAKRKAASAKEFNWSMLYMNSDAVASSIASRMNIPKSDILNPDPSSSTSAAVNLALAETHIIQETKSFLTSNGVYLPSFSTLSSGAGVRRSDTIILVKNIPYGTTEDQIRELFAGYGDLVRVLVPPAGTLAVVEFAEPSDAKEAFQRVSYRRLGNSVVYLEKGPVGMFQQTPDVEMQDVDTTAPSSNFSSAVRIREQLEGEQDEESSEPSLTAGSTLFVKNLAFSTTSDKLTQTFRNLPSFSFARVQTKPNPKVPGGTLSMGYGFVGFKDKEGAASALKGMQGLVLDGHALHVKFAGRGAEEQTDDTAKSQNWNKTTTKMIVKNVPFEATKKDIRQLFGSHGHLKSVRLPKKIDSRSRGFAFLDFTTRREAENAYATLRHTHLLGRHLVLEWANQDSDQDLEELRRKAGVGYGDGKELPGQKRKLKIGGDVVEDAGDEMD